MTRRSTRPLALWQVHCRLQNAEKMPRQAIDIRR
jgi:hypothetical protein